ncbi:MAG: hypothetical protein NT015_18670 [Alphaproteobacteria bacterium]|nr:hypothetical protein [Alphaproteobacteria bacterium]
MRKFVVAGAVALTIGATVAGAVWRGESAQAQPNNCSSVIQYDTTVLQTNYAAMLTVLNTVTQSNYQQSKQDLGASIPGYFDGSFSDFEQRRSELRSSFSQQQLTTFSQNLYQRLVSPQSARMYEYCMRGTQNFSAWVSSTGITNNRVAVTVRNNIPGTGRITYSVTGASPMNQPTALTSGSEETLYFNAPKNQDFFLVINARNGDASFSVPPIELPAYIEYRRVAETRTVTGTGRCGAGCQGNTSGCQLHRDAVLAAPSGYTLSPSTRYLSSRTTVGGPGINIDPQWTWVSTPAGPTPNNMVGTPGVCDGMSPHTQGITDYQFSIEAVRYRMEQVN